MARDFSAKVADLLRCSIDLTDSTYGGGLTTADFQVAAHTSALAVGITPELDAAFAEHSASMAAGAAPEPVSPAPSLCIVREPEQPMPEGSMFGSIIGHILEAEAKAQDAAEADFAMELFLSHFPDAVAAHYGLDTGDVWEVLFDLEDDVREKTGLEWLGKNLLYPFSYALAGVAIAAKVTGLPEAALPAPMQITIH